MITKANVMPLWAAVMASVSATHAARAGTFQFVTLQVPGMPTTQAVGIINSNQVIGNYYDVHGREHGFVWINGTFTKVDVPGAKDTELDAVNDSGVAVGVSRKVSSLGRVAFTYNIATGQQTVIGSMTRGYFIDFGIGDNGQAFGMELLDRGRRLETVIQQNGQMVPFTVPGEKDVSFTIQQINAAGELLGGADDFGNGYYYGFTYQGSTLTLFEAADSTSTQPFVFAPDGGIAGIYSVATMKGGKVEGFYLSGGNYTTYAYPRARYTELRGALSPSYVIGYYGLPGGGGYAFIFNAGTYTRYVPKGATSSGFGAMNANGSLVGGYINKEKELLGFVGICPTGEAPCMP